MAALDHFNQLHPSDQGELLVGLVSRHRQRLLATLALEIMEHLEPEEMSDVCQRLDSQTLYLVFMDVAANILNNLLSEQAREMLAGMKQFMDLLALPWDPDDTAGGMTPENPMMC